MERKQVNLKETTYRELEEWKLPGQSFDGAIQVLLQEAKTEVKPTP